MSQLKLTADGGGGTVAIKGPSSTTGNAAIDLTVPGTASATLDTLGRAGNILQVVIAQTSTLSSTTSQTFAEITTDLRATIVPTAATSKIIVDVSLYYAGNSASAGTTRILKDGSTIVSGGPTSDNRDGDGTLYANANWMGIFSRTVFETAGNTNSRYYSPFWRTYAGTLYCNRYISTGEYLGTSSIRVMEVAA